MPKKTSKRDSAEKVFRTYVQKELTPLVKKADKEKMQTALRIGKIPDLCEALHISEVELTQILRKGYTLSRGLMVEVLCNLLKIRPQ